MEKSGSVSTEKASDIESLEAKAYKPNERKNRKIKTCKCGILHTGYYGEICAVCMVYKRALLFSWKPQSQKC